MCEESKIEFDSLIVENSLSNRGHAQIFLAPLVLIGAKIIGVGGALNATTTPDR